MTRRDILDNMVRIGWAVELADRVICNTSTVLEPGALGIVPRMKPIGPLLVWGQLGRSACNFWPVDSSCIDWLHEQPPGSVIYVAFRSFTVFDRTWLEELPLELELTWRLFLWILRPDIIE